MQFSETWADVLNRLKSQTRRIVKPGQIGNRWNRETTIINEVITPIEREGWTDWRSVYAVGRTYSVQPGRGMRAVWYRNIGGKLQTIYDPECPASVRQYSRSALVFDGWSELRIKITEIRYQYLQDISPQDCIAELAYQHVMDDGEGYRWSFRLLWDRVHKNNPAEQWAANPLLWALSFTVF